MTWTDYFNFLTLFHHYLPLIIIFFDVVPWSYYKKFKRGSLVEQVEKRDPIGTSLHRFTWKMMLSGSSTVVVVMVVVVVVVIW